MGAICGGGTSLIGCLYKTSWRLVFDVLGMGWVAVVAPWGLIACLAVFFGEEVLGWVGSRSTATR